MFPKATNDSAAPTHARSATIFKSAVLHTRSQAGSHALGEHGIELDHLVPVLSEQHLIQDDRQQRREQKKERKLQEIKDWEEMKFSHSIQFNSVPDWSNYYISYSNLKKL